MAEYLSPLHEEAFKYFRRIQSFEKRDVLKCMVSGMHDILSAFRHLFKRKRKHNKDRRKEISPVRHENRRKRMKSRKRTMSVNRQTGKGTTQALKKSPEGKYHQHNRDISSKNIFDNRVLCAQFLRDNFDIPQLKNVQPEDIKDISERFHPYLGTEFQPDSVKKIRILDIEKEPSFLVSLIDHKSLVDYDVPMQLLRYMVCIWTEYRREKEKEQEGSTRRKDFRYPVIIPIVYFEGKEKWTAARNFCERIEQGEQFRQWIPDFKYELVSVHEHSDEELLNQGDETVVSRADAALLC